MCGSASVTRSFSGIAILLDCKIQLTLVNFRAYYKASAPPVPKVLPEPDPFMALGLFLSEKQIPKLLEITEKPK